MKDNYAMAKTPPPSTVRDLFSAKLCSSSSPTVLSEKMRWWFFGECCAVLVVGQLLNAIHLPPRKLFCMTTGDDTMGIGDGVDLGRWREERQAGSFGTSPCSEWNEFGPYHGKDKITAN